MSEASRTNFSSALSERTGYAICSTDIPVSRPNAGCSVTIPVASLRLLEIFAIAEIEAAVALQRVAEQAAVGIDGQYTGELRIFLAHGGKEGRTRRPVAGVEVAGAGQTVMQLGRALDFLVEVVRNIIGRCRQVDQGGVDFAGAVLQKAQPDEASRHQHGDDHQYQ